MKFLYFRCNLEKYPNWIAKIRKRKSMYSLNRSGMGWILRKTLKMNEIWWKAKGNEVYNARIETFLNLYVITEMY